MTRQATRDELRRQLVELGTIDPVQVEDPQRLFFPTEAHRDAIDPRRLLVVGERGAGKSALCRFLCWLSEHGVTTSEIWAPRTRGEKPIATRWIEGFAEVAGRLEHPSIELMEDFAGAADRAFVRAFWWSAAVRHLSAAFPELPPPEAPALSGDGYCYEPAVWASALRHETGPLSTWLDRLERVLANDGRVAVLTYDSLDRLGEPVVRARAVSGLLETWLSLQNRYRHISAKVFLRPDVQEASLDGFPDASKLVWRRAELRWERDELFGLLARAMAASYPELRELLEGGGEPARMCVEFDEHPVLGPVLRPKPDKAHGGPRPPLEQRVTYALAGRVVGRGPAKQRPAMWIGSRLADGLGRIAPRSLLMLVAEAARAALQSRQAGETLLTVEHLEAGLRAASRQRLREMCEDHPVVGRLKSVGTLSLPLDEIELRRRLTGHQPAPEDGFAEDGRAILRELERLGVVEVRTDRRLDVPEIYRLGLGFERAGAEL